MRIVLIGSLTTIIPPFGQSSVERLAYHQTIELAKRGHEITLLAPVGSHVEGKNISTVEFGSHSVPLPPNIRNKAPEEVFGAGYKNRLQFASLVRVLDYLSEHREHDVILSNFSEEAPVLASYPSITVPVFQILHVPIIPHVAEIYKKHSTRLISISDAERRMYPDLHYVGTVYNGVDMSLYTAGENRENYVLYLGSISPNKNPRDAILAAKMAGVPLVIGGKIKIKDYFEKEIVPHIDNVRVRWVGELTQPEVIKLYQQAKAFLFPTLWDEPFGLVAIEALACGTPVIAYPNGALPEIIQDGVNGFLVKSVQDMAEKIAMIDNINSMTCRKSVADKFSIEKMAESLEQVLLQQINKN